jgi:hypothetical protein
LTRSTANCSTTKGSARSVTSRRFIVRPAADRRLDDLAAQLCAGQRSPLILEIHGGPFAAYGPHFSTDDQLYAAAGYVGAVGQSRGSTSYGAEFANLIHHAYPGQDYDDLMSAVDAAIAQGFADPDHLFVTGGSAAACSPPGSSARPTASAPRRPEAGDRLVELRADRGRPAVFSRYWFGHYPWEDPQGFWSRSPCRWSATSRRRPGRRRQRGLPHPGQRGRAILYGAAAAGGADGLVKVPGRQPRQHRGAAVAKRGQGGRDPRLVRDVSERRPRPRAGGRSIVHARGGVGDVGEPGAGLALGFGDLAGGHVLGDVGPAFLGHVAAVEGGEVEPFVRFDEVDLDAAAAGRISDPSS